MSGNGGPNTGSPSQPWRLNIGGLFLDFFHEIFGFFNTIFSHF
mgnify:CR=1 FL=1